MSKQFRTSLIAIFVLFWSFGCGGRPATNQGTTPSTQRTNGTRGGTLTVRVTAPVKTLNYIMSDDEPGITVALFLMQDRLVNFDHGKLEFRPGLAESWTPAPDGLSTTVKLREGLKFSDGHALTADDVIFSLDAIYGVRTSVFRDAMLVDDKEIVVTKVNERELKFDFPAPVAAAENYFINLGILPRHVLEADLKAGRLGESWKITADPASIVTSGPFTVAAAVPGEKVELTRNPHYWRKDAAGTQLPYLDKLVVETISDANNTYARLGNGSLDLADRIRAADFGQLNAAQAPATARDVGPGLGIDHLFFNLNTSDASGKPLDNDKKLSWFGNKQFRLAISHAIDRETLSNATLQGLATPLYGFVSPANKVWLKPDLPKTVYDLKRAEQILTDAGFKKTGEGPTAVLTDAQGTPVEFTLIVQADNQARQLTAAAIQQDLAKLGIKVTVAPIETAKVTEAFQKTFQYDAALYGLSQTDLEPSSYQNFLLSSAPIHVWQPKQIKPASDWEARIDALFQQQSREPDREKRKAAFFEIQQIMSEQLPVIPIVARHVVAGGNNRIGNWSPSSILPYSLWNADELFIRQ
jgi:peptide/nickel transport system substrate-binding protein